jgi:hypothetical protein
MTEKAARACGFKIDDWYWVEYAGREILHVVEDGTYNRTFDPLHESDMAMEVAARLNIQINYDNKHEVSCVRQNVVYTLGPRIGPAAASFIPGDMHSKMIAVRRAVTLCAAQYEQIESYIQYNENELAKHERKLQDLGYEIKVDVSGGFWVASDGDATHVGDSRGEVIMRAVRI